VSIVKQRHVYSKLHVAAHLPSLFMFLYIAWQWPIWAEIWRVVNRAQFCNKLTVVFGSVLNSEGESDFDYLDTEDGGSKFLWNVGNHLTIHTASHFRRLESSCPRFITIERGSFITLCYYSSLQFSHLLELPENQRQLPASTSFRSFRVKCSAFAITVPLLRNNGHCYVWILDKKQRLFPSYALNMKAVCLSETSVTLSRQPRNIIWFYSVLMHTLNWIAVRYVRFWIVLTCDMWGFRCSGV
jgi:hypothetical protein